MLGNGDGTFQAPVSYASGGYQTLGVAIGDLNGDGKLDLVVVSSCAGGSGPCYGQVGVLIGNGDGTFQPVVGHFSGDSSPYMASIADVNGDGHPDLVVANGCHSSSGLGCSNPGSAGVLLGNGDGTFQPAVTYPVEADAGVISLAVEDLNGDGVPDVVVLGNQINTNQAIVSVLLGNGDGTFQPEIDYYADGSEPTLVAVADVNGDGHPDVVVASFCLSSEDCSSGGLDVLLGKGDGTLEEAVSYSTGGYGATSAVIVDVNGDGHPDLIAATSYENGIGNSGPGALGVLLGKGDGTFQAVEVFPSGGSEPRTVAAGDVNGDGKPDLLVANWCSVACTGVVQGTVGVLLNNSGVSQAGTATAMTSSTNPSGFNQSVTFKATVSSTAGTPAGTVIFYDGITPLGSMRLASRKAAITVSSLRAGAHEILAVYQGSSSFAPSASAGLIQNVNKATTAIALKSSRNPAGVGRRVTYTATVTSQYGGTETGTVTFFDNGNNVAGVTLSGTQASHRTTYSTASTHTITAYYSGDDNNASSASSALMEVIGDATETALTTSGSPSVAGRPVTFTAKVKSTDGAIPDGETVTFYDGLVQIGTGGTTGGVATITTSSLSAKTHTIKANYAGDTTFLASAGKVTQVVNKNTTTTALVSSLNPSSAGEAVTFTATVTSAGPTPTGKVKFVDGTTQLGSVTLSGGTAKLTKSNLPVGSHSITAQYVGDGASSPSTSPTLNQVVNP